jgi:TIR domain
MANEQELERVRPLRGQGPRVFISYSYEDAVEAAALRESLEGHGARVVMEDQSSLLGRPLMKAIPQRIAGSEVFFQLITPTSASSEWVAREFSWAISAEQRPAIVLAIVLGDAKPPSAVADWGFLPAPDGLTPQVLGVACKAALNALTMFTLDPQRPFEFSGEALRRLGASDDEWGRPLVDPDNLLLRAINATIEWARSVEDPPGPQIVDQQQQEFAAVEDLLGRMDSLLPHVAAHLPALFERHWPQAAYRKNLNETLQRFARLSVGVKVVELARSWPAQVGPVFAEGAEACLDAAERVEAHETGRGDQRTLWALASEPAQNWRTFGFDPRPGYLGVHLLLPDDFDDTARLSFQVGVDPRAEITTSDWFHYGIPQVLKTALSGLYKTNDPAAVLEQIGWELADYRNVGYY